jgi:hypothetical protein
MEPAGSEVDEWNAAAKRGAAARRRVLVPIVVAMVLFGAGFFGTFFALGQLWGSSAAEDEARKEEILRGGGTVIEVHRRGSMKETRAMGDGFLLFAIAAGAGLALGAAGFFVLGGRLSAEHTRGLRGFAGDRRV